nr:MAG TPA: hypothetical protein [Caudoviricetes sp.]
MPCFRDYEVGWSSYYSESAYVACVAGFGIRQKTKCGLRVGRMRKINSELDNQDGENELR